MDFLRKKNLDAFKKDGGVMIATTIYDEGIDIPQVNVLILAFGGKSRRKVLQRIGRALRKKESRENVVVIVDFWDHHNKYLLNHSKGRLNLYRDEGFEVVGANDRVKQWMESVRRPKNRELTAKTAPKPIRSTDPIMKPRTRQELIRKKMQAFKERAAAK